MLTIVAIQYNFIQLLETSSINFTNQIILTTYNLFSSNIEIYKIYQKFFLFYLNYFVESSVNHMPIRWN